MEDVRPDRAFMERCEKKRNANKKYRESHVEKVREARKVWLEKPGNIEKVRKYSREWYQRNPQQNRSRNLLTNFGITESDYQRILASQNGVCAICGGENRNKRNLAVDHCHKTNKIRGLLCTMCNTALGKFKDSALLLENAIKYLDGGRHDCSIS
jgi:hypothetical protein